MFNWIVDKIANKTNSVVQKSIDDVYSTLRVGIYNDFKNLNSKLDLTNNELANVKSLLYALVGTNTSPQQPGQGLTEEVKRYIAQVDNIVGGVVDSLPEPPASLTGRRRGTTISDR